MSLVAKALLLVSPVLPGIAQLDDTCLSSIKHKYYPHVTFTVHQQQMKVKV